MTPLGPHRLLSPVLQKSKIQLLPHRAAQEDSTKFVVLTLVSIAAMVGVLLASAVIYCLRHSPRYRLKEKLSGLGDPGPDATAAYQVKRRVPRGPGRFSGSLALPAPARLFLVWVTSRRRLAASR